MTTQAEKAKLFTSLHIKGNPLIIFNIWDAGSARAIQDAGAKVIATGSWAVAVAHGYADGEKIPLELVLTNLREIIATVDLPVSLDFEGGYGQTPAELVETMTQAIQAGAIGINFEDQIVGAEGLYSIEEQSKRIAAVRQAADSAGIPFFINARTDIFLKLAPEDHNAEHLEEAVSRAVAYAEAGANGFFAPGLANADFIRELCNRSPLPVNIMMLPYAPTPKELAELGVARVSYGAGPYRQAMKALREAGQAAFSLA